MKVLHLIGERVDIGGVLTLIRNLQEVSRGQGVQHSVWVHRDYVESRHPQLTYVYSTNICADSPSYAVMLWFGILGFFKLRRILKQEHFDVIHAHSRCMMLVALGVAVFLRKPVMHTNHNYSRQTWLYRFAARRRHFHTTLLTPSMARYYGIDVKAPRVRLITSCCSDEYFDEALGGAERWRKQGRRVRLMGVGNIVRWKNWSLLLQALAALPAAERARVEFIHWGPTAPDADSQAYHRELLQFIEAHDLKGCARFGGRTPSIVERLREADWFVLPSSNEPCSAALIEALALGLPALVSASGGNLDIVADRKTGLMFQPNDVDDLAAKIREISAPVFRVLEPSQIRESVRMRSAPVTTAAYVEAYRDLVQAAKPR